MDGNIPLSQSLYVQTLVQEFQCFFSKHGCFAHMSLLDDLAQPSGVELIEKHGGRIFTLS
jgi:hypothetical protein